MMRVFLMPADKDPYREYADTYDREAIASQWHGPEVLFGKMYSRVEAGQSVLDLGIGTGLGSIQFHKAGLKIHGLDGSPAMLDECAKRALPFELTRHDLDDTPWPFEANCFHHVISTGVFHFLGELDIIVTEVARVVRVDGLFGFDFYEYDSESGEGYTELREGIYTHFDAEYEKRLYRHSLEYILRVLLDAGFQLIHDIEFLASRNPKRYFRTLIAKLQ